MSWVTDVLDELASGEPHPSEPFRLGGVPLTYQVYGGERFTLRKSEESAAWPVDDLLQDLGVAPLEMGDLRVSSMLLNGSVRMRSFSAVLGFAAGAGGWDIGELVTLREVAVEIGFVGRAGSTPLVDVGLAGRGEIRGSGGGASIPVSLYGSRQDGSWSLSGEVTGVSAANLLAHLGIPVANPGALPHLGVAFRHESRDDVAEVEIRVDMARLAGSNDSTGVADVLARLAGSLDRPVPTVPSVLDHVSISDVDVRFQKADGAAALEARCRGWLGVDLGDPSAAVDDQNATPALALDIRLAKSGAGRDGSFGGQLVLGARDAIALDLKVQGGPGEASMVAAYRDPTGRPLDLSALAPRVALPGVAVTVDQVVLAWRRADGDSTCLLAVDVSTADPLNPNIPVVGHLFPSPGLSIGCLLVASSGEWEDVLAINDLLGPDARGLPPVRTGLNVMGRLRLGTAPLELVAADPAGAGESAHDPGDPAGPVTEPPPPAVPDESTKWVPVQRAFGPVHVARAGFAYADEAITIRLDASVELAGLRLSLAGLGLSTPLSDVDPVLDLHGIGVSYRSGEVEVEGTFLRRAAPAGQGEASTEEFVGSATVRTPAFSVSVVGALAEVMGEVSMFVFAALNRDLGGPPAFHVTGLALGFGYNRDFVPPAIEDVATHPFLGALSGPDAPPTLEDATAMLDSLMTQGSVPARIGSYWLAAGVKFSSFRLIDSRVVALVRLGHDVEILLLGLADVTLPRKGPPYVRAELALKVSVKPAAGLALAEAMLTDNSWVLDSECRLTGHFAFALWFGDHPHAGDIVLSLGGYHPRFRRPDHYPVVPRLGIAWTKGALTVKGEAYFALTPSCVMAGGQLEAAYRDGGLAASFVLRAHFLIAWEPFSYDVEIGATIHVALQTDTILGPVRLAATVGADVRVWGPDFAGTARVRWGVMAVDVGFGAVDSPKPTTRELTWPEFRDAFLPAESAVCEIQVLSGLVREADVTVGTETWREWVVRTDAFSWATRSAVPCTKVVLVASDGAEVDLTPSEAEDPRAPVGIQPMGTAPIGSEHLVRLRRLRADGTPGALVPVDRDHAAFGLVRVGVPRQLWSDVALVPAPNAEVLPGQIVGVSGLRPAAPVSAATAALPLAAFALTRTHEDKWLPLQRGPATLAGPGPVLDADETVIDRIATTVGDRADALREAVVEQSASRGFLGGDTALAEAVAQSVLAADAARHATQLASLPMLGSPDRPGVPATRPAAEPVHDPPPGVDLSVPAGFRQLLVQLLAEVSTRREGLREAASGAPASDSRHLVLDADPGQDAADTPSLERTLASGAGAVFGLDADDVRRGGRPAAGDVPTARLEIDDGADAGDLGVRVVELDRYGEPHRDVVRSTGLDLRRDTARVIVTAGPRPGPAATAVHGWRAGSLLLRVAPRVFLAEGGLVATQADEGDRVGTLPGSAMLRANASAASAGPGWTRTTLPAGTETIAVVVRHSRGSAPAASAAAGLVVELLGRNREELRRLVPRHAARDGETDVALLYAVPVDLLASQEPVTVRVRVEGRPAWSVQGVLGFLRGSEAVRRDWEPGRAGLQPPDADPSARRTIRLVRARVPVGA